MRYLLLVSIAFVLLTSAKPEKKLYSESLRPQFHFTPERNWMNDPNGLVYFDGEYHLFYQHNPNGKNWGFMHWGHAVSSDLLHWQHLPIAITPDENSTDSSRCTAYSGSAIVDMNNVAGFQKGDTKTLIIFYTSQNCGQRLAYSNDKGRTWIKYEKNPIITLQNDDARDPKVFFHQQSGQWVMVLYRRPDNDEKKQGISIYNSKNLIDWEFQSHIAGFFECPDLFELPLDGKLDNKKWALLGGDGAYLIGDFDGKKFVAQAEKKKLDYGNNFYATQTWSNQPEGKLIQIAWMRGGEYPEMPFNGQMSFPSELSLRTTPTGPAIYRTPIASISTLFSSNIIRDNKNYMPGLKENLLGSAKGDAFHIKAVFDPKTADSFGFMIRGGKKSDGTEIRYETAKKMLVVNGCQTKVEPMNGLITMEILVDRSSIELYCNDGEKVISTCFQPNEDDENIVLYTQGGELFVKHFELNKIKSVWSDK